MDIYKPFFKPEADEQRLVTVGRVAGIMALLTAIAIAPQLSNLEQAFQFIQDFTGLVSPGVVCIFIFGLFWKKASPNAALWTAIVTIPLSFFIEKVVFPDRMGLVFVILSLFLITISLIDNKESDAKAIDHSSINLKTSDVFNIASIGVFGILTVLYLIFW